MAKQKGRLFLLPSPIHENGLVSISPEVIGIIHSLDYFIVEKARTARRFVSSTKHPEKIEALHFEEMPVEDASDEQIDMMLKPCEEGRDIGLLSEAGLPAIADPGNHYVRVAQKKGIQIIPLPGPSSLMMALMASGLEGQRFAFHGYLSAKKNELKVQLKDLEKRADRDKATQLFIETPYRNKQVMEMAALSLDDHRRFCIAADMGSENGFVMTKKMSDWKKGGWPEIHKVPAVFLLM